MQKLSNVFFGVVSFFLTTVFVASCIVLTIEITSPIRGFVFYSVSSAAFMLIPAAMAVGVMKLALGRQS